MQDMNTAPVQKSSKFGCLLGCGLGCAVVTLLAIIILFFVGRIVVKQYNTVMERFEREGYRKIEQQVIVVNERITEPTIFVGQSVSIRKGSDRGIAMLCQTADIDGRIVGNVHFYGQTLVVKKDAELMQDLDLKAQFVEIYGVVRGNITGVYQFMNKKPVATETSAPATP